MPAVRGGAGLWGVLTGVGVLVWGAGTGRAAGEDAALTVADGRRVSIEYTLSLADESQVDTNVGGKPLTYTQGGGEILPALQEAVVGLKVGESKRVRLSPAEAYGPVDPQAFHEVDEARVPESARKVGAMLVAQDPGGRSHYARVHELKGDKVVLDFNHPLAGKELIFDVKILKIEEPAE